MKKQVNSKIVSVIFAVFVVSFAVAFYALGWTEPELGPPDGNVVSPINEGDVGQNKKGTLLVGFDGGLGFFETAHKTSLAVIDGNVGIGTTIPLAKLQISDGEAGNTGAMGSAMRIWGGTLGTTIGSEIAVASFGFSNGNNMALGVRGYRTATGSNYANAAAVLSFDVDNTIRNGGYITLREGGNVGIGVLDPNFPLDIGGGNILIRGGSRDFLLHNSAGFGIGREDIDNPPNWLWEFYINSATGYVGIGTSGPSEKLEVVGSIVASGTICDSGGTNCIGSGGSSGYKLLAAGSGRTEQVRYIITSSGITFETDYSNSFQSVNPIFYEWPAGVSEIIFEVIDDTVCIGGEGSLNLAGSSTAAQCTVFKYKGSTLYKKDPVSKTSWVRLSINGNSLVSCSDEIARTYIPGYPALYNYGPSGFCKYSKTNGDWTGEITEVKVEEGHSAGNEVIRAWKIWYK